MHHDPDPTASDAARDLTGDDLLRRAVSESGPWIWIMGFSAVVLALAETALPAAIGRALDGELGHGASHSWLMWCGLLVAGLIAFDVLDDVANGVMTATSTAWLRRTLVRHLLRVGPRTTGTSGGDLVNRVVGNASDAGRIGPELLRAAANLVPALGGIAALGLIDVWLLVTFLAGLPFGYLIVRAFAADSMEVAARYMHHQGRIATLLNDALGGVRTIAAAGTQDREVNRIIGPLPDLHEAGMATWRAQATVLAKDALLVPVLEVAVLGVAGLELSRGRISVGGMLAASQYVLLASNFMSMTSIVLRLGRSRAAANRTAELATEPPLLYGQRGLPRGSGRVSFRSVTVRRGDEVILGGLDLEIPAGGLVAVVGPSGSGKSTLTALIGRLVEPQDGEVLLDGIPVQDLSRSALREAVAYGFERPKLIGANIADAIAFGEERPPTRQIVAAASAARADVFIRRMPNGYDTPLGRAPMSGGEVQRIGLARAFAHESRVLVLDDVTSRLDTVTEHYVTDVLTSPRFAQTRVVVAHRASTAARADLVVWLQRGHVRSVGRHDELWNVPAYRSLFEPDRPGENGEPVVVAHSNGQA